MTGQLFVEVFEKSLRYNSTAGVEVIHNRFFGLLVLIPRVAIIGDPPYHAVLFTFPLNGTEIVRSDGRVFRLNWEWYQYTHTAGYKRVGSDSVVWRRVTAGEGVVLRQEGREAGVLVEYVTDLRIPRLQGVTCTEVFFTLPDNDSHVGF